MNTPTNGAIVHRPDSGRGTLATTTEFAFRNLRIAELPAPSR